MHARRECRLWKIPPLPELKYKSTMRKNFSVNLLDFRKLQVLLTSDREEYCVQGKTISKGKNPQSLLSPSSKECWRMTETPGKKKGQCQALSPSAFQNSLQSGVVQVGCKWSYRGGEPAVTPLWSYNHLTPNQTGFYKIPPIQQS